MISQWFNPRNINHIRAYDHLMKSGTWPENFLPEGVLFDPHWRYLIDASITTVYVDNMLTKHKDT
jgi:hypothetical protein